MLASPVDENKCKNPDLKRPLSLRPGLSRQLKIWILSNHDLQGRRHANGPGDTGLPRCPRPRPRAGLRLAECLSQRGAGQREQ